MIIVCHGSRGELASRQLPSRMRDIAEAVASQCGGRVEVGWAALQFNRPSLEEAADLMAGRGVGKIIIVPLFLFPGRHIVEDIPGLISMLRRRHPHVEFVLTRALGDDEAFLSQVAGNIAAMIGGVLSSSKGLCRVAAAEAIERQSMDIIGRLLPKNLKLSPEEMAVVRRIVHASGELALGRLVKFSPGAVVRGLDAIRDGRPIITDVRMLAVGIQRLAGACRCPVFCALDGASSAGHPPADTLAATGMRLFGDRLDGALVAIGNAPTALLALLEMVDRRECRPALVIGMPVGFVQAKESKEELVKRELPYITVPGTRGGSAIAAAAVNALLRLFLEKAGGGAGPVGECPDGGGSSGP
ncbi:MAG: precorrin-8X methylmutase [Dehalococcoidales bacterium]|nr:precorrin-8X methylmutase [Dehalococcoidales bacterium]